MREDGVKKRIKDAGERMAVPERLEPEQMMGYLRAMDEQETMDVVDMEDRQKAVEKAAKGSVEKAAKGSVEKAAKGSVEKVAAEPIEKAAKKPTKPIFGYPWGVAVAAAALLVVSLGAVSSGILPGAWPHSNPANRSMANSGRAKFDPISPGQANLGQTKPGQMGQGSVNMDEAAGTVLAGNEAAGTVLAGSETADGYRADSYADVYRRFQELRIEQQAPLHVEQDTGSGWRDFFYRLFGVADSGTSQSTAMAGGGDFGIAEAAPMPEMAAAEADGAGMHEAPMRGGGAIVEAVPIAESQFDAAPREASGVAGNITRQDYSGTNIQVEGVDEGDVVKTDGTYIYVASANLGTIRIISPNGAKMKLAGMLPDSSTVDNAKRIEEFYVNGDRMTVIRSYYEIVDEAPDKTPDKALDETSDETPDKTPDSSGPVARYDLAHIYPQTKEMTAIETYDLTNREKPELVGSVAQDGYYRSSRRSGDYVYVFTGYYAQADAQYHEFEKYIPRINGATIPAGSIYMPERLEGFNYLVIASIDMAKPVKPVQAKAVAASGEQYYVSGTNIYAASSKYNSRANQYDYTELMKFSYRDGRIEFACHGNVNGYLNDQFSMDEYQGKLRLVSTLSRNTGQTTNSLYVLDEKLGQMGAIEDLAPGEQIYSARFMGDIGYFVTFRNMDPLFSVDLSDPAKPKVLGELKITGFSEYLHPYLDGLLLGIGREINPDTVNFEGLKLSMFDTVDPKNVKEIQKLVEENYEYSPAWDNHKSVLISTSRNLIGLTAERYDYARREWSVEYAVYSYDRKNGFEKKLSAELEENADYNMARGLYIKDWLYIVENHRINVYSLKDYSHGGKLLIK